MIRNGSNAPHVGHRDKPCRARKQTLRLTMMDVAVAPAADAQRQIMSVLF
ncbi:hypothetical protein X737_33140 [Mesorhizobium sp. L48C026A00]|nr:hypothetical protein X737_33140 [Mesorhizobium sp. L48C026A00]